MVRGAKPVVVIQKQRKFWLRHINSWLAAGSPQRTGCRKNFHPWTVQHAIQRWQTQTTGSNDLLTVTCGQVWFSANATALGGVLRSHHYESARSPSLAVGAKAAGSSSLVGSRGIHSR